MDLSVNIVGLIKECTAFVCEIYSLFLCSSVKLYRTGIQRFSLSVRKIRVCRIKKFYTFFHHLQFINKEVFYLCFVYGGNYGKTTA